MLQLAHARSRPRPGSNLAAAPPFEFPAESGDVARFITAGARARRQMISVGAPDQTR